MILVIYQMVVVILWVMGTGGVITTRGIFAGGYGTDATKENSDSDL